MICGEYNPLFDGLFWAVTVLAPYISVLVACYQAKPQTFSESIDKYTSIVTVIQILIGVGIRFYVIESQQNFLQPTAIMIVLIMFSLIGARPRFVFSLATIICISVAWFILSVVTVSIRPQIVPLNSEGTYGIGLICLVLTSFMVAANSYETELFHRHKFLMEKEMKKNNAKLKNQLTLLAKSYNQQAVRSLDSPLERSMMVIRSVMADPTLTSRHLLALGQVTSLLASSNLLTPDFEGTVAETMDNEQQVNS